MTYVEQYGIACMTLAPEEFDEVFSLVFSDCDPHFELFSVREGAVWEKAAASAADGGSSPRQIAVRDSCAVLSASLFVDSACRHRKIRLDDGRGGGVSIEPSSEKSS